MKYSPDYVNRRACFLLATALGGWLIIPELHWPNMHLPHVLASVWVLLLVVPIPFQRLPFWRMALLGWFSGLFIECGARFFAATNWFSLPLYKMFLEVTNAAFHAIYQLNLDSIRDLLRKEWFQFVFREYWPSYLLVGVLGVVSLAIRCRKRKPPGQSSL